MPVFLSKVSGKHLVGSQRLCVQDQAAAGDNKPSQLLCGPSDARCDPDQGGSDSVKRPTEDLNPLTYSGAVLRGSLQEESVMLMSAHSLSSVFQKKLNTNIPHTTKDIKDIPHVCSQTTEAPVKSPVDLSTSRPQETLTVFIRAETIHRFTQRLNSLNRLF